METLIPIITLLVIFIFVIVSIKKIATEPESQNYKGKKKPRPKESEEEVAPEKVKTRKPDEIVKTNIVLWGPWDAEKAITLGTAITKFNKSNRRINVTYVYKQNLDLALSSIVSNTNAPDIILFDRSNSALYVKKKYFIQIDSLMESENVSSKEFLKAAIDELIFNSSTYALPLTINTKGLFFNKDIFNELAIEAPPKNWVEVSNIASEITMRSNGELIRAGFAINDESIFPAVLNSNGGKIFNDNGTPAFNSPEAIEILQRWHDLIYKDKVYDLGFGDSEQSDFFSDGRVAMKFGDTRTVRELDKKHPSLNYGIAPIPAGSQGYTKPIVTGYGMGIYKQCENPEFAFDVLKHFTCNQGFAEELFISTGLISANTTSHKSAVFKVSPRYSEMIDYMVDGIHIDHVIQYNQIEKEALLLNIQMVLSDIITPKAAMEDAEKRARAILGLEEIKIDE